MSVQVLTVRRAMRADADRIVDLGIETWPDAPFSQIPPNRGWMRQSIMRFLATSDAAGWLLWDGDALVGVLAVSLLEHWMTAQKIAVQWWWWIRPEHRNGQGLRLLREAERWAAANGATAMHLLAVNENFEALCQALRYNKLETTYTKELRA